MLNPAMWGRAAHGIVRLDKAEWDGLDYLARWLIATRAAVLIMTVIPAAIGGLLAARDGAFDPGLWAACTLGLVLAHAANNLLNDMVDHRNGVDHGNYFRAQYGVHPLEHGFVTFKGAFVYFAVTGGAALVIGAWLVHVRGPLALALMAAGAFFVLFYTWPLKYIGLGEVAVLLVWGPLMTGGTYFVTTGLWSWEAAIVSLPSALGATTVLFGKHIDKRVPDQQKRIRTMPVLLGERNARYAALSMMALQYAIAAGLVFYGFSLALLAVFFEAKDWPLLHRIYRAPKPEERPDFVPEDVWPLYYSAGAFIHCRNFGLLYLAALAVDAARSRWS